MLLNHEIGTNNEKLKYFVPAAFYPNLPFHIIMLNFVEISNTITLQRYRDFCGSFFIEKRKKIHWTVALNTAYTCQS